MIILRKQFFERLQKNESPVVRGLLCTQRGRATRFKSSFTGMHHWTMTRPIQK